MSEHRVVVYTAQGCHLCEAALEVVAAECGASFTKIDIGGDADLEQRYRSLIPVVEIDGERAFTYFVQPDALRQRLSSSNAMKL